MNWYARISIASRVVTAQPNYFSTCPKCREETLYDLIWEKRQSDPAVWGVKHDGTRISYGEAHALELAGRSGEVKEYHSRERLTCPHCKATYFAQVIYNVSGEQVDLMGRDEAEPVPDAPPTPEPYSEQAVAAA